MNGKSLSVVFALLLLVTSLATVGLLQETQAATLDGSNINAPELVVLSTPSSCPGGVPSTLDITRGTHNYRFSSTGSCTWASAFIGTVTLVSGSHWELTFGRFSDDGSGTYKLDSATVTGTYDLDSGGGPSTADVN